jgi:hypothetical protein
MTKNLAELKDKLYSAFDLAYNRATSSYESDGTRNASFRAVGTIAQAIVEVETRIDEREKQSGLRLPGKG